MVLSYGTLLEAAENIKNVTHVIVEYCNSHVASMSCPSCGFDWDSFVRGAVSGLVIGLSMALAVLIIVLYWKCYVLPERYEDHRTAGSRDASSSRLYDSDDASQESIELQSEARA